MRVIRIGFDEEKPFLVPPSCDQPILGHVGEANAVQFHMDVSPIHELYPNAEYSLFVRLGNGLKIAPMIAQVPVDGVIQWPVHESLLTMPGEIGVQLIIQQDDIIAKTYEWVLRVEKAIVGQDRAPEPLESYLTLLAETVAKTLRFQAALENVSVMLDMLPEGESASGSGHVDLQEGFILRLNIPLSSGESGGSSPGGKDGREVELRTYDSYLQWRYYGEEAWINLFDLSLLDGKDGTKGFTFIPSISDEGELHWTNDGGLSNPPTVHIKGVDGTDGREILLRTAEGYIQWQYTGDTTWNNVVVLSSLRGGTFTPIITEAGLLSWTNDLGLDNPAPISVIGPEGKPGSDATVPSWVGVEKPTYTATEVGAAQVEHSHSQTDVTGLTLVLSNKAESVHVHSQTDVTGLTQSLSDKANASHSHSQADISGLTATLSSKATATDLVAHSGNTVAHVTTADRSAWDGKATSTHSHTLADLPIIVNTTDLEPGVSPLPTGTLYFVYE